MKRTHAEQIARETVAIVDRGGYAGPAGRVEIAAAVAACLDGTRHFAPNELLRLGKRVLATPAPHPATRITVENETTLAGVRRLLAESPDTPVAALNFASAKNPGGGFLRGSQAQEESLARSSALYASLLRAPAYYDRHRDLRSCLYTDAMILSPGCPVFRDDDGTLLDRPYLATFLTSAAPNAGAIAVNSPEELPQIPAVLRRRAELVLALAAGHDLAALVLGAWGCGVFRNDPATVAGTFADLLRGAWAGRFRRVHFAVLDTLADQATVTAFRSALA